MARREEKNHLRQVKRSDASLCVSFFVRMERRSHEMHHRLGGTNLLLETKALDLVKVVAGKLRLYIVRRNSYDGSTCLVVRGVESQRGLAGHNLRDSCTRYKNHRVDLWCRKGATQPNSLASEHMQVMWCGWDIEGGDETDVHAVLLRRKFPWQIIGHIGIELDLDHPLARDRLGAVFVFHLSKENLSGCMRCGKCLERSKGMVL